MSSGAEAIPRMRPRLTRRAAVLGAVILILAATAIVPFRQYLTQRSEIGSLERKIEALIQERNRLEVRIEQLNDPKELERIARECLGMVKPGEIAFVAVPKSGRLPKGDC
jgi:cell division protein FtsB